MIKTRRRHVIIIINTNDIGIGIICVNYWIRICSIAVVGNPNRRNGIALHGKNENGGTKRKYILCRRAFINFEY